MKSFIRHEIKSELAYRMVGQAVDYARAKQWNICAALCDPRGHLVALARTDNVVTPAIQYAIDKAWTSATLATTTEAFFDRASSRPSLAMGLVNRERILVFPGGFPLFEDNVCIGGLGVSGAQDQEDVEIAKAIIELSGLAHRRQP